MKALITGGSRGIGLGIGNELAQAGHDVLLVAKSRANLEKATRHLSKNSKGRVLTLACDLARVDSANEISTFCDQNRFVPDVLVLNAGIFIEGTLIESKDSDFESTLNVNLLSIYRIVRRFVPKLAKSKRGHVILIGSTAAYEPYKFGALYGVAKWALRGYAKNLRQELIEKRIAVTLLSPGGTLTDLWAGEKLPPNRLLKPSDIGKLVQSVLTLSDQAVVEEIVVRPILGDLHE